MARTAVREPCSPTRSASIDTSDVALGVELLLLRAHDRLQRRVARLVDRVSDADHGRKLDLDGVVAVLGLALEAQLAVGHVHLDHLRQRGHLQVVGDDGADRVALAVVRLLAEQHEIGALGLEHLGEGVARRRDVGARERVIGEVDRAVGAERHRLVERAHRALGAHRHGDDLVDLDLTALLELHRGLDGVRVERVQVLLAGAVEPLRALVDALLNGRIGDFLDQATDLQASSLLGVCGGGNPSESR